MIAPVLENVQSYANVGVSFICRIIVVSETEIQLFVFFWNGLPDSEENVEFKKAVIRKLSTKVCVHRIWRLDCEFMLGIWDLNTCSRRIEDTDPSFPNSLFLFLYEDDNLNFRRPDSHLPLQLFQCYRIISQESDFVVHPLYFLIRIFCCTEACIVGVTDAAHYIAHW